MQTNTSSLIVLLGLLFALMFTASCKNDALIRPGDSIDVAYRKALQQYREENYRQAATAFQTVVNSGRGTDYAQSAQLYLANSYFEDGRYLLAANSFERYTMLYPRSPKRKEAAYKEALSYYNLSPRYRLDQTYTRQAIEKFRLYMGRYPDDELVDQAAEYLTDMRSKLARKHYHAADLYMRTDQYEAALIYYNLVISEYPETEWAERALVEQISAYNEYASRSIPSSRYERYQKAVETYEKYLQLFPNGANRERAEEEIDEARQALANISPVIKEEADSTSDS